MLPKDKALFRVPKDLVEVLRVQKTKIYELIEAGEIKAKKLGRSTVVTRSELERFINELPERVPKNKAS